MVYIPHYGTIVVGGPYRIGNYVVLHTGTCIVGGGKEIGDFIYLSVGSIITGSCSIGKNVTVAINSLDNNSCGSDVIIADSPAVIKKQTIPSGIRDGREI